MSERAEMSEGSFFLATGRHPSAGRGRCAMEWVANLAGERHSDTPRNVSPVLAGFLRSWNDALDDRTRQRLRPFLARTIGTADDGLDDVRGWACADWLTRVSAPALLEHADLHEEAHRLRELPPLDASSSSESRAALSRVRRRAGLVRRELREQHVAAHAGALDAARHSTRAVPALAGCNAARAGLRGAGSTPEREAIADSAWHTGWDAAWSAAWRDGLEGVAHMHAVVIRVQLTAFELLERMLPTVWLELPPNEATRFPAPLPGAALTVA